MSEWIVPDADIGCDGAYYGYKTLIRCKDCKHKNTICNYCHKHDMNVTLESFCSWAERITDIRDCENCTHHTEQGCTKWDCEFERRTE